MVGLAELWINAGELRQSVTLQSLSTTRDAIGGVVQTWADVATVRAKVEPMSAHEKQEAAKLLAEVDTTITLRYRADVVSTMRAVYGSDIYDIRGVENVLSRNRKLILTCRTLV